MNEINEIVFSVVKKHFEASVTMSRKKREEIKIVILAIAQHQTPTQMEQKQYELLTKARHLRYLFFIETTYDSKKLINLFRTNQNYWGGRLNPIIPVENGIVSDSWKSLIKYHDPDYVLYTSNINEDYVEGICYESKFNPTEIQNLDEPTNQIEGVNSGHLFDFYKDFKWLIATHESWKSNSPLKEYFELNYCITDYNSSSWPADTKYNDFAVGHNQYDSINDFMAKNKSFFNKNRLATTNLSTIVLRDQKFSVKYVELIIAKDYTSFNDLIYFWNRELFIQDHSYTSQFIVTLEQFELLILDPGFGTVLDQLYSPDNEIDLVSFSLSQEQLLDIKTKLKAIAKQKRFEVKPTPLFPFEILDRNGLHKASNEKENIQIINSSENLINNPPLSFGGTFNKFPQKWALDVRIIKESQKRETLKFPYTFDTKAICNNESRINRDRELTFFIHSQLNDYPVLKIRIPSFYDIAYQLITSPRFINTKPEYVFSEIQFNDSSSKLKEFLKLFGNQFHYLQEFIYDKFWMDHFTELANNTRVEGDCFTFNELLEKCIRVLNDKSSSLDEPSQLSLKKVPISLSRTLQELCEKKILLSGFIVKCQHCSSKVWYSLNAISDEVICRGCSNLNTFKAETPIAYKLNHLIKNNISTRDKDGKIVPDGNMTVIRALNYLSQMAFSNFEFLPQVNIYAVPPAEKPETDLDIICLVDGELYIGECKHNSALFKDKKSLDHLLEIASKIWPDTIVLACTVDTAKGLQKAKHYVENKMRDWEQKPIVLAYIPQAPDYFAFDGYRLRPFPSS